jgi:hypothetical protein
MPTINTDVVAAHAQHVHLFATELGNAKNHAVHDGHWTEIALGGLGQIIWFEMDMVIHGHSEMMGALSEKAADVKKRIDSTAQIHHFTEQANTKLMDATKTKIADPDLFHAPKTLNDFPDMNFAGDIAGFAANCPQYAEAGAIPVVLGSVGLALDVLGFALDPVGNVFGTFAGLIIDMIVPLKKVLDFLLGDPGALQDASTAFDQIAQYMSEIAHTFSASLSQITPQTWNEPGASDVYLKAANNLIQLTITAGTKAESISGDILVIGSFLGDLRANVFDHIVGFVIEALFEAAMGVALSEVTFGASLAVAAGVIETEAAMTAASIAAEVAAAVARMGAAALVAKSQGNSYKKLVADIKK